MTSPPAGNTFNSWLPHGGNPDLDRFFSCHFHQNDIHSQLWVGCGLLPSQQLHRTSSVSSFLPPSFPLVSRLVPGVRVPLGFVHPPGSPRAKRRVCGASHAVHTCSGLRCGAELGASLSAELQYEYLAEPGCTAGPSRAAAGAGSGREASRVDARLGSDALALPHENAP